MNIDEKRTNVGFRRCLQIFDSAANPQFDVVRYNLMKGAIEYKQTPVWREDKFAGDEINTLDESAIRAYLCRNYGFDPKKQDVRDAVIDKAIKNPVHPIRDYLESIVWDAQPRLESWLYTAVCCDDNRYSRAVAKKFLMAAVKRILEPGSKFDHMVIFEGGQGIYKSELLKILGGEHYAALSIEVSDKALMENMCGKWFIEFDEMSGWGKQDVERVKSLITRTVDRRRPPYGLQSTDFKRQCVLAGTLNPKKNNEYLQDDTGNRRFWPIVCKTGRINIEWVKENRDQLFAEAKVCYERGDSLWLDGEGENEIAVQVQNERLQNDSWGEIIRDRLKFEAARDVSMSKILTVYLGMRPERITKAFETRVGIIMGKIEGWEKVQDWKDRKYFYRRCEDEF